MYRAALTRCVDPVPFRFCGGSSPLIALRAGSSTPGSSRTNSGERHHGGREQGPALVQNDGIWSVFSKKRGRNRKPGPPVHNDLVERDFTAAAPNELWLADITEHPQQRRTSTSAR
jgi:transposase InsO family protein